MRARRRSHRRPAVEVTGDVAAVADALRRAPSRQAYWTASREAAGRGAATRSGSSASSGTAASRPKPPLRVRRSAARCAAHAQRLAQVAGERPHVGAGRAAHLELERGRPRREQQLERVDGDRHRRRASTGRARARQLVEPLRPPTRLAEKAGGTCSSAPVSARQARAQRRRRSTATGRGSAERLARAGRRWWSRSRGGRWRGRPSRPSARKRARRVALPTQTGSTPVAKGSSVPVWPDAPLRPAPAARGRRRRARSGPAGLSTTRTPCRSPPLVFSRPRSRPRVARGLLGGSTSSSSCATRSVASRPSS